MQLSLPQFPVCGTWVIAQSSRAERSTEIYTHTVPRTKSVLSTIYLNFHDPYCWYYIFLNVIFKTLSTNTNLWLLFIYFLGVSLN